MKMRANYLRNSALGRWLAPYGLRGFLEDTAVEPDLAASGSGTPFVMGGAPGPVTVINGRKYIYFGGTGYFCLQGHAEISRAGIRAFKKYGMHSAASRTGFGNNPVLLSLEKSIATYFGTEDSLYFPSAYFSGLFMARGMADTYDVAFVDETAHFSVMDGLFSARKPVVSYKHRDPADLGAKLRSGLKPGQRPLVISDGVFPAYGAIAPVPELLKELEPYGGSLCLDDAHGVGVLGANGRGTYEHFGLAPGDRLIMSGTLSKAFGGYGGFIPGSPAFIQKLRQTVGAYAGASCPPTPIAAGAAKGVALLRAHPEWRAKLRSNVARAKVGLNRLGFDVGNSPVPIIAWTMGTGEMMKKAQKALLDRGIAVAYLKYVGAPEGGILRASIFSAHTHAQIDKLLHELGKLC